MSTLPESVSVRRKDVPVILVTRLQLGRYIVDRLFISIINRQFIFSENIIVQLLEGEEIYSD